MLKLKLKRLMHLCITKSDLLQPQKSVIGRRLLSTCARYDDGAWQTMTEFGDI